MKNTNLSDRLAAGFLGYDADTHRYNSCNLDPLECHGMAMLHIPENSKVLDVGCGEGRFALAVRDVMACDVTGIEPNRDRADVASTAGLGKVVVGYLDKALVEEFAGRGEQFDIVIFMDVLEHMADPSEVLAIAKEILRENGKVIVSVPNVAHWTVRLNLLRGEFNYHESGIMDATHLRWFTRRTIRSLIERSGFRIDSMNVSRGFWMYYYRDFAPWRLMPGRFRNRVIDRLCRWFPGLFGCQHIVVIGKSEGFERR